MVHFPLLVSLNISKEEELSENVKDLPVLCDKVLEGFKEKDTAKNPWCDIARALEFALNDNYVWFYTFNCNFLKMASLNQFCGKYILWIWFNTSFHFSYTYHFFKLQQETGEET